MRFASRAGWARHTQAPASYRLRTWATQQSSQQPIDTFLGRHRSHTPTQRDAIAAVGAIKSPPSGTCPAAIVGTADRMRPRSNAGQPPNKQERATLVTTGPPTTKSRWRSSEVRLPISATQLTACATTRQASVDNKKVPHGLTARLPTWQRIADRYSWATAAASDLERVASSCRPTPIPHLGLSLQVCDTGHEGLDRFDMSSLGC